MNSRLSYYFSRIDSCNMCGSVTAGHKILGKRLNASQGTSPGRKIGIAVTISRCSDCGLIYANPQPVPFDLQDHYGVLPESYWKEGYFVHNDGYFEGEIKRLRSLMDFREGMKSLDVGAGLGKAMRALAQAGFDAYGFEPSRQFHERAVSEMGISPDKLKLGMIEDVDYSQGSFDFISFSGVLEHLYDPSAAIVKAMKWLKPAGIVHIEVPSSDWLIHKLVNLFYRLGRTDYVGNISPMHNPYHLYEFGLESFRKHSVKHGYELALHEYYVCQTYMPKLFDPILKYYMKKTNTGMQLCVWLRKR